MSSRSVSVLSVIVTVALSGSIACWEQWGTAEWFPQMKRQLAVQAFEDTGIGTGEGLSPPEGTVPVGDVDTPISELSFAEQEALTSPVPASLESLENGRELFANFCVPCHGPEGHGDGPVAGPPFGQGIIVAVLPIGGPSSIARGLTDGHIVTTISLGRGRMPSYRRIPKEERWDLVNWIRYLNGQGGRP